MVVKLLFPDIEKFFTHRGQACSCVHSCQNAVILLLPLWMNSFGVAVSLIYNFSHPHKCDSGNSNHIEEFPILEKEHQ